MYLIFKYPYGKKNKRKEQDAYDAPPLMRAIRPL